MMMRLKPGLRLIAVLVAAASLGCSGGPNLPKVKGKVTLDGQPLGGAEITFVPEQTGGERATGFSKPDGTFEVMTGDNQGVNLGEYKVLVTKIVTEGGKEGEKPTSESAKQLAQAKARRTNSLPTGYSQPDTTPFRCKVPASGEQVLDVKSSGP